MKPDEVGEALWLIRDQLAQLGVRVSTLEANLHEAAVSQGWAPFQRGRRVVLNDTEILTQPRGAGAESAAGARRD